MSKMAKIGGAIRFIQIRRRAAINRVETAHKGSVNVGTNQKLNRQRYRRASLRKNVIKLFSATNPPNDLKTQQVAQSLGPSYQDLDIRAESSQEQSRSGTY